jgi:adenine-specific DNA-methyltransferase
MEIVKFGSQDKSSTVLDFFAGSGTTLHAVMQLNKEDGGKRQCILVTNNENNICREVTYERNKRVIEGYTTPKGVQVEGLRENNLRYYHTHLLPRERTNRNMRRLVAASTDLLCIKENIFDEIQVSGFKFQARDARLFSDGERAMMVIYNEEVIPDIVEWLQGAAATIALTYSRTNAIKVYVFSPGAYAWDDDFAEVIDRVELCALPEAIYQAYKSVLPKKRVRRETTEGSPKEGGEE